MSDLQKFVDEVREVCNRHGMVIIGSCASEGMFGEIAIFRSSEIPNLKHINFAAYLTNEVRKDVYGDDCVIGIGEVG
jgi:hypothetical protein